MANPHINYATFKSRFGDLGITEWTKYNYLSNYNFGLPAQTEVPTDKYLELEYIQSGGAQYIDLDHIGNERTYVEIDAVNKDITLGGNRLFGARTLSDRPDAMFISTNGGSSSGSPCFDYYQFGGSGYDVRPTSADRRMYNIGGDDVEPFETPEPLLLFNAYSQSAPSQGYWAVYNAKLYQDKVLIRDMHPVKRLSDGVLGMYDTVNGTFYQNRGTGSFTAGPMKQRYVRVEYVQFNGNDAINTGLITSNSSIYKLEGDLQYTAFPVSDGNTCINGGSRGFFFGQYFTRETGTTQFIQTIQGSLTPTLSADLNRHHIISIIDPSKSVNPMYIDNVLYTSNRSIPYVDGGEIMIGDAPARADQQVTHYYCKEKVYYFKLSIDDVLVRNFVPVYDLVTEKYGLFDLVSGTFYGSVNNKLTGPWGNIKHYVFTQANAANIKWYGEFASLGTLYIDLGPTVQTGPAETWGYDLQNAWHYAAPHNTSMTYREQDAASTIGNTHNMNRGYVFVPSVTEENARAYLYAHPVEFWLFAAK